MEKNENKKCEGRSTAPLTMPLDPLVSIIDRKPPPPDEPPSPLEPLRHPPPQEAGRLGTIPSQFSGTNHHLNYHHKPARGSRGGGSGVGGGVVICMPIL